MTDNAIRPEGITVEVNVASGFALLHFDGTSIPPIRLKKGELSNVGGTIAGVESTLEQGGGEL